MSVENLLGISQGRSSIGLGTQKFIGYPSNSGEKTSLELKINVRREFFGYPSKAGLVSESLYIKAYRVSLKGR
jgi:hypothetical protein